MRKIITVIGARPQFVKAAVVSRAVRPSFQEIIIHTGQHYDMDMSDVFFTELDIPKPDYNLGVGSGHHGLQTGLMLQRIEKVIVDEQPDIVLVFGDTNSTLAGALAASKLNIPVAHVEAGLRSFNRKMPEEINRVLTDHISDLCFCPTDTSVHNLECEGIQNACHLTGDVMYDAALFYREKARKNSSLIQTLALEEKKYCLCTIHRPHSTDNQNRLTAIMEGLVQSGKKIVLPLHPRTKKAVEAFGMMNDLRSVENLLLINPVSYLDMICLEVNAEKIITDSGGVQKEAYFFDVPCITIREETEWVETVEDGWNILVGTEKDLIYKSIQEFQPKTEKKALFGDGHSAEKIANILDLFLA